jgi:hypothetical protein
MRRWFEHLDPGSIDQPWTTDEDQSLLNAYQVIRHHPPLRLKQPARIPSS